MAIKTGSFTYKNSVIAYSFAGNGPVAVLCLHGYGEDRSSFHFLENYAGDEFTFYAIDLPFHGDTHWNEELRFTDHDLAGIIQAIIPAGNRFYLTGFSLGGRVALSLYQLMPERVEKIILMAPDGLKVNFWYWLSTQTWAGNRFFRFTMKYPGWFFGFLKLLNKAGLVNASIFKFVNYYIGNPEVRSQLYTRWTTLRKLKPRRKLIKSLIKKQGTPVRLVYGKHDRIILASVGEKFRKGIEEYCRLDIIPSGHQVLHEKHAEHIVQSIRG